MKIRIRDALFVLLIVLTIFVVSFCEFNGVYFIIGIPLLIALFFYKNYYFLWGCLGMLLASVFINARVLPIVIIATSSFFYLLGLLINRFNIPLKILLSVLGAFYGFSISWMSHFSPMQTPLLNVLLVSFISYVLCYIMVDILIDIKSKETFSITKKQLAYLGFFLNILLYRFQLTVYAVEVNFVLVLILNYLIIKLDPFTGLVTVFCCLIFNFQHSDNSTILLSLVPLVICIKEINRSHYLSTFSYLIISTLLITCFGYYQYIPEVIITTMVIALIPYKFFSFLNRYIIEPKDYELKNYQLSYYKCMNRNKRIKKVMDLLEDQMRNNPKMKKKHKEIILKDMQFLSGKLNEEDNVHLKENLLNELNNHQAFNVVAMKLDEDYLGNYSIYLETSNSEFEIENIKEILENNLQVKLELNRFYHHRVLDTCRLYFSNEEKLSFNLSVKQRSMEKNCCGDSYVKFRTKNKKYILISDGMGHGKRANKASSSALLLLKNFIELGMPTPQAIISCNALIWSKDKESFNTLDLLEYDMFDNNVYLYKNGSGTTYQKHKAEVKKYISENLPLGIVDDIKVDRLKLDLDSDYLVLTSDGLQKDISELLKKSNKNVNALGNEILAYQGNCIEDDQTIIVINFIKK